MTMEGWQRLTCDCGSQQFIPTYNLSYHATQGTASKQDGWQCAACSKRAPMAALVEKAKKLNLQKKLEELNAQL